MNSITQLYRRFDDWVRNLSRAKYTALSGLINAIVIVVVSAILFVWVPVMFESFAVGAVGAGVGATTSQYLLYPNEER